MKRRAELFKEQCARCRFSPEYVSHFTCEHCKLWIDGRCLCLDAPDEGEVSCIFYKPYKGGNSDNE